MHEATSFRVEVLASKGPTRSPRGAPGGRHGRLTSRTRAACRRACVPERPVPRRPRAPTSAVGWCPGSGVRRIQRIPRLRVWAAGACGASGGPREARWFPRGGGGVARRPSRERRAAAGRERRRLARRRRRRRHVERPQLLHQLGGGRVCGVCGAHLLGHVRYRLHPSVLGRLQLHPAVSGPAAKAAGESRGPEEGASRPVLPHTLLALVRNGTRAIPVPLPPTTDVTVQCSGEVAVRAGVGASLISAARWLTLFCLVITEVKSPHTCFLRDPSGSRHEYSRHILRAAKL